MNKKHTLFIEDMRSALKNAEEESAELHEDPVSIDVPDNDESSEDFDLQAELKRKFEELFGPIDDE